MKKWLLLLVAAFVLTAVGCSEEAEEPAPADDQNAVEEPAQDEPSAEDEEMAVKSSLVDFQLQVVDALKSKSAEINNYYSVKDNEEATEEELQEAKTAAKDASTALAADIRAIEVPDNFGEETQQKVSEGLDKLAQSYDKRAEAIEKDDEALTEEAEALFDEFEKTVGDIYAEVKMLAPSFKAEIN